MRAYEQGLQYTEEFLGSENFRKLYEKMKRESPEINPGLSEANSAELTRLCRERCGCLPPQGWLMFLRIVNGYEFNAQVVYNYFHPDKEPSHFFEDNARITGKRKYLLIGREDEGYYAYNLKTGEYVGLDSEYTEDFTYDSFETMFLHMMWKAFHDEEFEGLFPDFIKSMEENLSDAEITWDHAEVIAMLLCKEYPKMDVLSLSDDELMENLETECITDMLPPLDPADRADVLFRIKCAISRIAEGDLESIF